MNTENACAGKTRVSFTLKGKLILGFLAVILIMLCVLIYSVYEVLEPQLVETQLDMQTRYAQILARAIWDWKEEMEQASATLTVSDEIQRFLRMSADERQSYEQQIAALLYQQLDAYEGWTEIWLVSKYYQIVGTSDAKSVRPYVLDRISSVERMAGASSWDSGYDTTSMMLCRTINDSHYQPNTSIGYLFIRIESSQILALFDQYRLYEGQRFSLKGQFDGFEITEQGFFYNYYDDYANLIHVEILMPPWYLRTWSNRSAAMEAPNSVIRSMLLITLFSCAGACALCMFIAQQVTKPVTQMKEAMRHYGVGDFSAKVEIRGRDEMAELGSIVNDMSERISELFEMVRAKEKSRRKLELQTLIYQINPHFLYNTLDSINAIARSHHDEEVVQLVTSLSRLFRLGLHQGQEFVSVRDEVMHALYYLRIQKVRFGDQLAWDLQVSESLSELRICKFVLQPIVENAIVHGVRSRMEGGRILLSAQREENELLFEIRDNGMGMSEEELEKIRLRLAGKTLPQGDSGYGLWNVNQRIRMYYGPNYGVRIFSEYGAGTTVIVKLRLVDDVPSKRAGLSQTL